MRTPGSALSLAATLMVGLLGLGAAGRGRQGGQDGSGNAERQPAQGRARLRPAQNQLA